METVSLDDYFEEIEAHFAMRRSTPFILSAKDWVLMKKWREEGIPLAIVIEAIDTVFEKNESSGRNKVISSLSYCRHAVKELWQERKELHVGEAGETPETVPDQALDSLADGLLSSAAPAEIVSRIAARVRELASERSVPRIEERLIEIEREMIDRILDSLPPDERSAIRDRVGKVVGEAAKLDEKTRARTEEANLRRLVRERFDLPRLTLFR